jgi:hypothetical protein
MMAQDPQLKYFPTDAIFSESKPMNIKRNEMILTPVRNPSIYLED